jgi:hypothetical protein
MSFSEKDIGWLYKQALRYGKNRRRYYDFEGKRKAYFVLVNKKPEDEPPDLDRFPKIVKLSHRKIKPRKKKPLKGPQDIAAVSMSEKGLFDYPFLSIFERKILTRKLYLRQSLSKIGRAYSGGRDRRAYNAGKVKRIVAEAYQKIREHEMTTTRKKKISVDLMESTVTEADRIAAHLGKTRSRIIHEALIEYIYENAPPNTWETEHFTIDFNRFNRLQKRLVDLANEGFIGISGEAVGEPGETQFHYK